MKTKNLFLAGILFFIIIGAKLYAQEDMQVGKSQKGNISGSGALYDYSDPDGINIKVMVWGYVKFPGMYIIPSTYGINNLMGLAGGPVPDASLDELKLFRITPDSSQKIIQFNYTELLEGNSSLSKQIQIPRLLAGDILLVPGSPKWYARDYLGLVLSIVGTMASIATLLVYIYK